MADTRQEKTFALRPPPRNQTKCPKKVFRCCAPGTLQCTDCWRDNFAKAMRDRVQTSDLHRVYAHSQAMDARGAGLAPVITGRGIPADVRGLVMAMVDNQEMVDEVNRLVAEYEALRGTRVARAKIYVELCDNATRKCGY